MGEGVADVPLAVLDALPELVVDDPELRHVLDHPLAFRVRPGLPLAGRRILDEALSIPDQLPDVHLVVDDAGPAPPIAIDRRGSPSLAVRPAQAVAVERQG